MMMTMMVRCFGYPTIKTSISTVCVCVCSLRYAFAVTRRLADQIPSSWQSEEPTKEQLLPHSHMRSVLFISSELSWTRGTRCTSVRGGTHPFIPSRGKHRPKCLPACACF